MSSQRHESGTPEELYSAAEAAKALRCSVWWLKEQARNRRIPFLMLGGAYRFTAAHLAEIIALYEYRPPVTLEPLPGVAGPRTGSRRDRSARTPPTGLRPRPPRRKRAGDGHDAAQRAG